jgi:chromosome partitioning protein
MQRILVLNAKGGCGKTTIATNLAGYFASQGLVTALLDYDPQGSSLKWLSLRDRDNAHIQGIAAFQRRAGVTRAFQMYVPGNVQRIIIDAPAGTSGLQLVEYVQSVDTILVPVLPSPIDIHAAAHFIQDLLLIGKVRSRGTRLAIVANRVRQNTLVFKDLERFLNALGLPFAATLRDSQYYMRAAEKGLSIHELQGNRISMELERWAELLQWLDGIPSTLPLSRQLP